MKLNDLSPEDLDLLAAELAFLRDIATRMADCGLDVRFDLTPGQPARVIMPVLDTMPSFDAYDLLQREAEGLTEKTHALANQLDGIRYEKSLDRLEALLEAEAQSAALEAENASLIEIEEPQDDLSEYPAPTIADMFGWPADQDAALVTVS